MTKPRFTIKKACCINQKFPQIPLVPIFSPVRIRQLSLTLVLGVTPLLATPTLTNAQISPSPSQLFPQTPQSEQFVQAQVVYVDPVNGVDSETSGNQGNPYQTLTYALQKAKSGVTVQLAPGTYSQQTGEIFPISVPDGVVLRGDASNNGQNVVIMGGGNFVSPTFARQNVTLRTVGNSQISGVTVTNPNTRGTALWVESSAPTISNSTFVNSKRDGIFISAEGNPKVENNIFAQNEGNGISVARSGQGEIRSNLFQNTGFAISINDQAAPQIVENKIIENRDGIVVSHTAQPIIRNNLIENNTRDGVVAIAQSQPNLGTSENPGNNIIRSNGRYDVYNATRGNTLLAVGNEIDESRISGAVEFVAASVNAPNVDLAAGTLSDLRGHWAQAYIEALVAQGIMSGFDDGSFRPDEPMTRVQFAAIVQKAFSPAPQQPGADFSDVSANFWGYNAIQTAYRGGFLSGYPDGQFKPNEPLTRIQGIVGLAKGLGYTSENTDVLSVYRDLNDIPNWALQDVAGATQKQLIVNYPQQNQLNPNQVATRADIAAFVYQALVNAGKAQAIDSPYLVSNP
jgi:parallel beta-helix repeat protein